MKMLRMGMRCCLRRRGREVLGVFLVLLWECAAEPIFLVTKGRRAYLRTSRRMMKSSMIHRLRLRVRVREGLSFSFS